jgi:hypothetical protein
MRSARSSRKPSFGPIYPAREAFKAFSQNIGHSSVITTVSAYCPVSTERQGELIKNPQKV